MNNKTSATYRFLRKLGLNYPVQEYGNVTLLQLIRKVYKTYRDAFLLKHIMESVILAPLLPRKIRPWVLRKVGCHVGKHVFIGSQVYIDAGHADKIYIEDYAHVTAKTILLCHKRELRDYCIGDNYANLPYKTGEIHLGRGCSTGTGTLIMPGVSIGEGTIIGAGSLVTRNIPAWSVAVGRPAKIVKYLEERT